MQAAPGIRLALPDRRNQLLAMVGVLLGLAVYFSASAWLAWDLPRASVLFGAAAAFTVTLRWRWGVVAVLVYVTVEGLVGNLLYPETFPVLLKDGLISGAYLGFAASLVAQRQGLMVPASVLRPFVALVALCVVDSFNPRGYDPLVALVGFRVLVFYIPLFALGVHLSRTGVTADRLAVFVLLASIPITVFGIAEYLAGPHAVASLGPGFARTVWIVGPEATTDFIFRPASTFAFVGHFGAYLLFIGVIGFAALHLPASAPGRVLRATAFALASVAIVLQSQRTTWVLLPVAMLAIYLLNGRLRGAVRAAPVLVAAIALVATVGAPVLENRLPGLTSGLDPFANHLAPIVASFTSNLSASDLLIGHGTGTALGAARYVTGGNAPGQFESGWFQPFYMFGIWGLLAYLWLYSAVLRAAWQGVRSLPAERRWLSTGLFVFLLLTAAVSGPINYPPTNVFFWLFAGLLTGQAVLARQAVRARQAEPAETGERAGQPHARAVQ
jgi:hypothetical protein